MKTIIMDVAVENAMKDGNVNLSVDVEKSRDRTLPQDAGIRKIECLSIC